MPGPLHGIKIVEFAGLGPAPFCAMVLADLGAEVLRIARPGTRPSPTDVSCRNRASVPIDLRAPASAEPGARRSMGTLAR
ncbi:MAG: CoA transferase, partial [Comamonadaceae bacterium]